MTGTQKYFVISQNPDINNPIPQLCGWWSQILLSICAQLKVVAVISDQELTLILSHSGYLTGAVFRRMAGFANNMKEIVGVRPLHSLYLHDW